MSTLFIEVAGLYLACHEPVSPAVVVREKVVVDACPVSLTAGIKVGMGAGQARAILHELMCFEFSSSLYEEASCCWLNRLCAVSDSVEVVAPHQAFVDMSGHPDPYLTALEVCYLLPFEYRGAVSGCRWVARALAPSSGLLHFPRPFEALAPYGLDRLEVIEMAVRERLAFLGYRTIGEVQGLSLATLKSQFGLYGLTIRQAAMGMLHEPVVGNYPPSAVSRRLAFDGLCSDSSVVSLGLEKLAGELAWALSEGDLEAKGLELFVEGESGEQSLRRQFGRALNSALRIRMALLQLWADMAVTSGVVRLRAVLHEVGAASRRQVCLSGLVSDASELPSEAVDRLSRKYGSTVVVAGSSVKVPRRKEVLRVLRATTGWY
ncbi:MAG: hypothetical protein WCK51_10095 [Armatimonadota bacterium]